MMVGNGHTDLALVEQMGRRLAGIQEQINEALERGGRSGDRVTIIGVTKTVPVPVIRAAAAAGLADCGENRVQEAREKLAALEDVSIRWHMIGHLQSNKVRYVVGHYHLIHSLDRLSLAQAIDRRAQREEIVQDCLVQVNVAREPNKSGIDPDELVDFLRQVSHMPGIRVRGLMTIAPLVQDPEDVRPVFRRLRELAGAVRELDLGRVEMDHLSMGMTGDFQVAVEEGATMVRIGRALFGPRPD